MGAASMQAGAVMKKHTTLSGLDVIAAVIIAAAVFVGLQPFLGAQSMVSGYWNPLGHQDNYHYGGGPDPGDFSGLPITDAARKAAQQYDADEFEIPELM